MQAPKSPHESIDMSFDPHRNSNAKFRSPELSSGNSLNNVRNTFERGDKKDRACSNSHRGPTTSKYAVPEDGDPWEKCYRQVKEYDDELFKGWRDQVDKLLIFASLLAATVTSFVIDSWKNLQEDPADRTNWFLEQLLLEIHNAGTGNVTALPTPQKFTPATSDVRLNVFWFMSLALSLATVLIGIICSQWLREYSRYSRLPPLDGVSVRQLRYEGLFAWKVPNIVMALPVLLQFSLVLFFVGLLDQLWNLNSLVAAFSTVIIGLALSFVIVTTLLPSYQLYFNHDLRSPLCPYKSPQAWVIHRWITRIFRFVSTSRTERHIAFSNDKTWVNSDLSWHTMKKRSDHTHVHNDTVRALVWIDTQLENSLNMVYSIYHCIKNLLPEESAQVVSQINHRAHGLINNTLAERHTMVTDCPDTNLMLYLKTKCRTFPQLKQYHLDSVIHLLNARLRCISRKIDPPPSVPWALYDVVGIPEDLVIRFLLCAKDLISLEKLSKENIDILWHLTKVTTTDGDTTHQLARHRKIACDIVLALERHLPESEILDPSDAEIEVKHWASHVIDLFEEWPTRDLQSCGQLVLEAFNQRIRDFGGPDTILSLGEKLAWENIVSSAAANSGPIAEDGAASNVPSSTDARPTDHRT